MENDIEERLMAEIMLLGAYPATTPNVRQVTVFGAWEDGREGMPVVIGYKPLLEYHVDRVVGPFVTSIRHQRQMCVQILVLKPGAKSVAGGKPSSGKYVWYLVNLDLNYVCVVRYVDATGDLWVEFVDADDWPTRLTKLATRLQTLIDSGQNIKGSFCYWDGQISLEVPPELRELTHYNPVGIDKGIRMKPRMDALDEQFDPARLADRKKPGSKQSTPQP